MYDSLTSTIRNYKLSINFMHFGIHQLHTAETTRHIAQDDCELYHMEPENTRAPKRHDSAGF